MVHPVERVFSRAVLMVVGPTPNDRIQLTNQHALADRLVRADDSTDFLQEHVRVLLRRFHQWFAVVFAEVLSEEVEPLVNMSDAGLVRRERKPGPSRTAPPRDELPFPVTLSIHR